MQNGFPTARDDDPEDVAWALTTGSVLWKQGEQHDAIVWLKRGVEAAMSSGRTARADELNRATTALIAAMATRTARSFFPAPTEASQTGPQGPSRNAPPAAPKRRPDAGSTGQSLAATPPAATPPAAAPPAATPPQRAGSPPTANQRAATPPAAPPVGGASSAPGVTSRTISPNTPAPPARRPKPPPPPPPPKLRAIQPLPLRSGMVPPRQAPRPPEAQSASSSDSREASPSPRTSSRFQRGAAAPRTGGRPFGMGSQEGRPSAEREDANAARGPLREEPRASSVIIDDDELQVLPLDPSSQRSFGVPIEEDDDGMPTSVLREVERGATDQNEELDADTVVLKPDQRPDVLAARAAERTVEARPTQYGQEEAHDRVDEPAVASGGAGEGDDDAYLDETAVLRPSERPDTLELLGDPNGAIDGPFGAAERLGSALADDKEDGEDEDDGDGDTVVLAPDERPDADRWRTLRDVPPPASQRPPLGVAQPVRKAPPSGNSPGKLRPATDSHRSVASPRPVTSDLPPPHAPRESTSAGPVLRDLPPPPPMPRDLAPPISTSHGPSPSTRNAGPERMLDSSPPIGGEPRSLLDRDESTAALLALVENALADRSSPASERPDSGAPPSGTNAAASEAAQSGGMPPAARDTLETLPLVRQEARSERARAAERAREGTDLLDELLAESDSLHPEAAPVRPRSSTIAPKQSILEHRQQPAQSLDPAAPSSSGRPASSASDAVPATSLTKAAPTAPNVSVKPGAAPSTTSKPTPAPSTTSKPAAAPAASSKPAAAPSTTSKPAAAPSTTSKPAAAPSTTSKPTPAPSTTSKPAAAPSTTSKPAAAPSTTSKPAAAPAASSKPAAARSTSSKPASAPSTGSKPAAARSTGSKPVPAPSTSSKPAADREAESVTPASPRRELRASAGPRFSLEGVLALDALSDEQRDELTSLAKIEILSDGDEIRVDGLALLLQGAASIHASDSDAPALRLNVGDVVFPEGTLADSLPIRVVATETPTKVATWMKDVIHDSLGRCPGLLDELRQASDRMQALAGCTMGPLGDRLDEGLRTIATDPLDVRVLEPNEVVVESGQAVPGLVVVGAGALELEQSGRIVERLGPGDFLFAAQVLAGGPAPASARAGARGCIILFAARRLAHELLVTCPPLLEILAEM